MAEIAVIRRMRMRGSVMGFGLPLVEKGRLEISRRAVLWELLEGGFGFERSSQWEIER